MARPPALSSGGQGGLATLQIFAEEGWELCGVFFILVVKAKEEFGETHSFSPSCLQAHPLGFAETRYLARPRGGTDVSRWARRHFGVWYGRAHRCYTRPPGSSPPGLLAFRIPSGLGGCACAPGPARLPVVV